MYLATWHWHIEISSKCTLRCPRCARQEVPDTLVNTELDLEFFQRNFTPEFVKNNVEKIINRMMMDLSLTKEQAVKKYYLEVMNRRLEENKELQGFLSQEREKTSNGSHIQ